MHVVDLTQDDDDVPPSPPLTTGRKRRRSDDLSDFRPTSRQRTRNRNASTTWDEILAPVLKGRNSPPPLGILHRTSPAARAAVRNLIRANHANTTPGASRRRRVSNDGTPRRHSANVVSLVDDVRNIARKEGQSVGVPTPSRIINVVPVEDDGVTPISAPPNVSSSHSTKIEEEDVVPVSNIDSPNSKHGSTVPYG